LAGSHKGGYISFEFNITNLLKPGKNVIIVNAKDDVRNPLVPRGKQSELYHSHDCDYTRTTGIWQTVWLEFVPKSYIKSFKIYPDQKNGSVDLKVICEGSGELKAEAFFEGKPVGSNSKNTDGGLTCISVV
jgi:beta-galactosidase/beta-glucuronidase